MKKTYHFSDNWIIPISFILGILICLLDVIVDVRHIPHANFWGNLFHPFFHEALMRLVIVCVFLFYGILVQQLIERLRREQARNAEKLERDLYRQKEKFEKDLDRQREKFEELKIFAQQIIHDLRSPATSLCAMSKLIREKDFLDDKTKLYLGQIFKLSENILHLVSDIQTFIQSGQKQFRAENVNVGDILEGIGSRLFSDLNSRGIEFNLPEALPEIQGDILELQRAFSNLIENALKYGGKELTKISVEYRTDSKSHIFSVIDNGKGIPEKEHAAIFRSFVRGGASRGIEGFGLGLGIVKEIIARHGGEVKMESTPKRGTAFHIFLPKNL